jgi:hypothetical protein
VKDRRALRPSILHRTHTCRSEREGRNSTSKCDGVDGEPRYWFKAKSFGYGWGLPATIEGWVLLIGFLVLAVAAVAVLPEAVAAVIVALLAGGFLFACYAKGEPPKWRAGRRP